MDTLSKKYLEKKASLLDKILNVGKSTLRGNKFPSGISLSPVQGLKGHLGRASDFGNVVSDVMSLTNKAEQNRSSIAKTYSGLFSKNNSNPASLFRQARNAVKRPLGPGSHSAGKKIKEVAIEEVEQSILKALSRQSHDPNIEKYTRALAQDKKGMGYQVKKVMQDYAEGKEPMVYVPNGSANNKHLAINVERPISTFNGSPVVNIEKTMGIDGMNTFNNKHLALQSKYNALPPGSVEAHKAGQEVYESQRFGNLFENKLRLMSSSNKGVNSNKFTLDDLDSVEKLEVFLKNPHLTDNLKLLNKDQHNYISNEIINRVANNTSGSKNIKDAVVDAFDHVASDPYKANYMEGFQFKRFSADEMKEALEVVRSADSRVFNEYARASADALGVAGLGALAGGAGYMALSPKSEEKHLGDDFRTKMLQHRTQGI